MRTVILLTLASINITLLGACTTLSPARLDEQYLVSNCSPMEGYPDCENGHRVASDPVIGNASSVTSLRPVLPQE